MAVVGADVFTTMSAYYKTDLRLLVQEIRAMDLSGYTQDSVAALQTELEQADQLLMRPDAAQQELEAGLEELKQALAGLEQSAEQPSELTATIAYTDRTDDPAEKNKVYFWAQNTVGTATHTVVAKTGAASGTAWRMPGKEADEQRDGVYSQKANPARTENDFYSIAFTGSQLKLYATTDQKHGLAMISVDGGPEQEVDFWSQGDPATADKDIDRLVFDTGVLEEGDHVLKVRVLNKASSQGGSSNGCVSFKKAEIYTGGSVTEPEEPKADVSALYSLMLVASQQKQESFSPSTWAVFEPLRARHRASGKCAHGGQAGGGRRPVRKPGGRALRAQTHAGDRRDQTRSAAAGGPGHNGGPDRLPGPGHGGAERRDQPERGCRRLDLRDL